VETNQKITGLYSPLSLLTLVINRKQYYPVDQIKEVFTFFKKEEP